MASRENKWLCIQTSRFPQSPHSARFWRLYHGLVSGNVAPPTVHPNDPVVLQLNDTTREITVFSSLTNALRCMEQMRQREQWLLQASDDIFIVSCGAKLVVCESTLINQKLFASFMPIYVGGQTRFAHRSMSSLMQLGDALQSVGFCLQGQTIQNNYDLINMQGPPNILIVDWNFSATPDPASPATTGSLLDDGVNQLVYYW